MECSISDSFEPRETPKVVALAAISWSENLEKREV
jgi:hypothetical protein